MSLLELKVPPVALVIIFAFIMWLVSTVTPDLRYLVSFRVLIAIVLVFAGALFSIAGVVAFKKARTTVNPTTPEAASSLVTLGIYNYTRNPMYAGFLLALLGWGIYLSNLYSLAFVIGFVLYMNRFQIQPEERMLEAIFGPDFLIYKSQVRRWL